MASGTSGQSSGTCGGIVGTVIFGFVMYCGLKSCLCGDEKKAPSSTPRAVAPAARSPTPVGPTPPALSPADCRLPRMGVAHDQIAAHLQNAFALEDTTPVDGCARRMGKSESGMAMLEIIGPADDVARVTLMAALPKDAPAVVMQNSAFFMVLLRDAVPEWKQGQAWFNRAVRRVPVARDQTIETRAGAKLVRLRFLQPLGMLGLTIEAPASKRVASAESATTEPQPKAPPPPPPKTRSEPKHEVQSGAPRAAEPTKTEAVAAPSQESEAKAEPEPKAEPAAEPAAAPAPEPRAEPKEEAEPRPEPKKGAVKTPSWGE